MAFTRYTWRMSSVTLMSVQAVGVLPVGLLRETDYYRDAGVTRLSAQQSGDLGLPRREMTPNPHSLPCRTYGVRLLDCSLVGTSKALPGDWRNHERL